MKSKKEHYLLSIESIINDFIINHPYMSQNDKDQLAWIKFYAKELSNECKDCKQDGNESNSSTNNGG